MEKSSQKPSFGQGLELAIIIEKAISNAVKKTNADSDMIQKVIGKPGVIFNFFESLLVENVEVKSSILRLISGEEKLMIEALDGKARISDAKKIFKSYIDVDFANFGFNQSNLASTETLFDVSEMTSGGKFVQIFFSITPDLSKIFMTQHQIIRFCEKYSTWLRQEGHATLFLTKLKGVYFVVHVRVSSGGMSVRVHPITYDCIWHGAYRHRVVSPQLIPLAE